MCLLWPTTRPWWRWWWSVCYWWWRAASTSLLWGVCTGDTHCSRINVIYLNTRILFAVIDRVEPFIQDTCIVFLWMIDVSVTEFRIGQLKLIRYLCKWNEKCGGVKSPEKHCDIWTYLCLYISKYTGYIKKYKIISYIAYNLNEQGNIMLSKIYTLDCPVILPHMFWLYLWLLSIIIT